jgi:hypothetical protein
MHGRAAPCAKFGLAAQPHAQGARGAPPTARLAALKDSSSSSGDDAPARPPPPGRRTPAGLGGPGLPPRRVSGGGGGSGGGVVPPPLLPARPLASYAAYTGLVGTTALLTASALGLDAFSTFHALSLGDLQARALYAWAQAPPPTP